MNNQNPGIIAGLRLDGFGPKETEITNNLATVWYIASANIYNASRNVKFPFVFLKATHDLVEKFNFRSDLLCLFHPYESIDSRLIEAAAEITSRHSMRLDRLCVVLITNATGFTSSDFSAAIENDLRVFVPFKYSELSGGAGGKFALITSKLEQYLYTKDLFSISSALQTEKYFFGRKNELQELVHQYQAGENSSIFGLRRIGKTSLLWALVRELKHLAAPVAFIDCTDTRYHKTSWYRALFRVKELLFNSSGLSKQGHNETDYTEAQASICFTEDLKFIKFRFNKPTLLIFDEVESLCFDLSQSPSWFDGTDFLPFWQTIRATFQQNPNLISFVLCGVNPQVLERSRLPNGSDNPLYDYIKPTYLGFFDADDVRAMLTSVGSYMGVSFDAEVFTYLTDDFGGHPFLIRQASSRIWKSLSIPSTPKKIHIKKQTYISQRLDISNHTRNYINLILEVLTSRYPTEYALLKHIAAGDHLKIDNLLHTHPTYIDHLLGYGLISKDDGKYHFRIRAVEDAIKIEARDLICPESVEERWASLSKERNALEQTLKSLIRSQLKLTYGAEEAKNIIISCMTKQSQKEKAITLNYNAIFLGEIYFLNYRDVITKNWNLFKLVFNDAKGTFSQSMEMVNKYRADAHANEISKDQFREAMPKLIWLSRCLEDNT